MTGFNFTCTRPKRQRPNNVRKLARLAARLKAKLKGKK
jgi:hypothetical protein